MAEHRDLIEVERAIARFNHDSDHTRLFKNWPFVVRRFLAAAASIAPDERPIVAHVALPAGKFSQSLLLFGKKHQPDKWCLLTNRYLTWVNSGGHLQRLAIADISEINWSAGPEDWPGRAEASPRQKDMVLIENNSVGHCSAHSPWLEIMDQLGKKYLICLEKGSVLRQFRFCLKQLISEPGALARAIEYNQRIAGEQLDEPGSDVYRLRRFSNTQNKQPLPAKTFLFASMQEEKRQLLLSKAFISGSEIPVLCSFENSEQWFLVTTQRAVWQTASTTNSLRYCDIKSMGKTEMLEFYRNDKAGDRQVRQEKIAQIKLTSPHFFIDDNDERRWQILFPSAADLEAIWSALRFMRRIDTAYRE